MAFLRSSLDFVTFYYVFHRSSRLLASGSAALRPFGALRRRAPAPRAAGPGPGAPPQRCGRPAERRGLGRRPAQRRLPTGAGPPAGAGQRAQRHVGRGLRPGGAATAGAQ